jgi:arylsulfatase A-like enzyme
MREKPNIILFITHDQGQFLGCYDSPQTPNSLNTPNLDELAKKGVRFTNHFCTAPQCSPSRGSIMTSEYPHQNGLMGLVNLGWTLPHLSKTFPMYLREDGYDTHLIGLEHESRDIKTLGYNHISQRRKSHKFMIKTMEEEYHAFFQDQENSEKPFFLNIGTFENHRPFQLWDNPVDSKLVKVPPFLPDNEMVREDLGYYYGIINEVDIAIGKTQMYLEEYDLKQDTLFIYTTDHGCPFPRAKCTLYDPGIKTALIMNYPNSEMFQGGKVIDPMISNIDLLPSILDLIGSKIPKSIQGKSFLPLLKNESGIIRNEIFAEKTYHNRYDPIRCVRTTEYKYIRNFESLNTLYELPLDIKRSLSGKSVEQNIQQPRPEEELYDLNEDPNEIYNLVDDDNFQEVLTNLRNKLSEWMEETNDPLLKGRVKPQEGVTHGIQGYEMK